MLKVNELAKKAGEAWKTLTDEDKKPFVKKADADKARYAEEVRNALCTEGKAQTWPPIPSS